MALALASRTAIITATPRAIPPAARSDRRGWSRHWRPRKRRISLRRTEPNTPSVMGRLHPVGGHQLAVLHAQQQVRLPDD